MNRFWSKVNKEPGQGPNGDCWQWTAGSAGKSGYGAFKFNKVTISSHRMGFILQVGEIPKGMWVLHRCDNRLCVRKEHLFLGTPKDNHDDMVAKGRRVKDPGPARMIMPDGKNWCNSCKEFYSISNFNKNKSTWNGLNRTCRDCKKKENKKRKR